MKPKVWYCNPLQTPMVPATEPYIGFDNQIHWKRILVPKRLFKLTQRNTALPSKLNNRGTVPDGRS